MLLFRIYSVPVVLAPSWWLGSVVVAGLYAPLVGRLLPGTGTLVSICLAAAFTVLLGLSVLAHELGHCLTALWLGIPVRGLRLFLLGGVSEVGRARHQPSREGWIAAAGPAVSLALAGLFGAVLWLARPSGAFWLLVIECTVANLAVAVFNLLPGLPLDGGRILRAGVWAITGKRRWGTNAAAIGGWAVATALLMWALIGLAQESPDRWLRLGVCVLTAWFVVAESGREIALEQRYSWPAGLSVSELVRPIRRLPAGSSVTEALVAAKDHGVLLVHPDGLAAGMLDESVARELAQRAPHAPAEQAAQPIRPDIVLFASESGEEIAERVHETAAWQFLVVDDNGDPSGILRREDLRGALSAR